MKESEEEGGEEGGESDEEGEDGGVCAADCQEGQRLHHCSVYSCRCIVRHYTVVCCNKIDYVVLH